MRMNRYFVGIAVLLLGLSMFAVAEVAEEKTFEVHSTELAAEVLDAVENTFKERGALTSEILGTSANIEVEIETTISMTFVGEGAGYKNSVGYFTYNSLGEILEQHTVFANFSGTGKGLAGGGDLNVGDTVEIGTFQPGEKVGFFLLANGFRRKNAPMWSTVESMNYDGKDHDAVMEIEEIGTLIGFEDLRNLGDRDYNDAMLLITSIVHALEEDLAEIEQSPFAAAASNTSAVLGISEAEAMKVVNEYGIYAASKAAENASDAESFWASLLGYDVLQSAVAGGGGAAGVDAMYIDFQLHNPVTGNAISTEHVSVTVVDENNNIVEIARVAFNDVSESYTYDLHGLDLEPGNYDLYLGFGNGTSQMFSLVVPELG